MLQDEFERDLEQDAVDLEREAGQEALRFLLEPAGNPEADVLAKVAAGKARALRKVLGVVRGRRIEQRGLLGEDGMRRLRGRVKELREVVSRTLGEGEVLEAVEAVELATQTY